MNIDKTKYLVIPFDSVPSDEALLEAAKRLTKDRDTLLRMCNLKEKELKYYNEVVNFLEYITKISGRLVVSQDSETVAVSADDGETP